MGKKELVDLLVLSFWCLVIPGQTHLLFLLYHNRRPTCLVVGNALFNIAYSCLFFVILE